MHLTVLCLTVAVSLLAEYVGEVKLIYWIAAVIVGLSFGYLQTDYKAFRHYSTGFMCCAIFLTHEVLQSESTIWDCGIPMAYLIFFVLFGEWFTYRTEVNPNGKNKRKIL